MYNDKPDHIRKMVDIHRRFAKNCSCPAMKAYLKRLVLKEIEYINYLEVIDVDIVREQLSLSLEELKAYDGSGGKPAYAAVNGIIYDLSMHPGWGGGTHFGLYAGNDLTDQFEACHKAAAFLTKLKKIGVLKK